MSFAKQQKQGKNEIKRNSLGKLLIISYLVITLLHDSVSLSQHKCRLSWIGKSLFKAVEEFPIFFIQLKRTANTRKYSNIYHAITHEENVKLLSNLKTKPAKSAISNQDSRLSLLLIPCHFPPQRWGMKRRGPGTEIEAYLNRMFVSSSSTLDNKFWCAILLLTYLCFIFIVR